MKRFAAYVPSRLDKFGNEWPQRDLLQLAWLTEQAACWRKHIHDAAAAEALFRDAAKLRDAAQ
jgi:hypothetical protein